MWIVPPPLTMHHGLTYTHIFHLRESIRAWDLRRLRTLHPEFLPLWLLSPRILAFRGKGSNGRRRVIWKKGSPMNPWYLTSIVFLSEGGTRHIFVINRLKGQNCPAIPDFRKTSQPRSPPCPISPHFLSLKRCSRSKTYLHERTHSCFLSGTLRSDLDLMLRPGLLRAKGAPHSLPWTPPSESAHMGMPIESSLTDKRALQHWSHPSLLILEIF